MATNNSTNNWSPLTTKGDLFTFDTSNTRLAVGSNGKALFADSTNSKGVNYDYTIPKPTYYSSILLDFLNGGSSAEVTPATAASGTGAQVTLVNASYTDATAMGVLHCDTGTTTNGIASVNPGGNNLKFYYGNNNGQITVEGRVLIPTLSDGTDTFTVNFGLCSANRTATGQDNSVYFNYTNGTNSGKWQGVSTASASSSTVDLSSTVTASTWYNLKVTINSASTLATFYINNVSAGTINSNIPAGSTGFYGLAIIAKSAGTNSRFVDVDYIGMSKEYTTPR